MRIFFRDPSAGLSRPNDWRKIVPELIENCQLLGKA
jgi:hypothetical protein